tara:strand:- start:5716 stop:5973 length:258 start_codon:yes stop_codon:yes gene_type:complete
MPILLKHLEGTILTYIGGENDFTGSVRLVTSIIGEVGLEDYFKICGMEAFTQNFSSVDNAEFCETTPILFGSSHCTIYENLNLEY